MSKLSFEEFIENMRTLEIYRYAKNITDGIFNHFSTDEFKIIAEAHRQMMEKINDKNEMYKLYLNYMSK